MPMTSGATLTFLGAAGGTVTGSKHLLEHGGHRMLLDCGLITSSASYPIRAPRSSSSATRPRARAAAC
jgi:Cft2 family RNA processing exonuclease